MVSTQGPVYSHTLPKCLRTDQDGTSGSPVVCIRSALCEWVGSRIPALGEGTDVDRPYSTEDVDGWEECTGHFRVQKQRQEPWPCLTDGTPLKAIRTPCP